MKILSITFKDLQIFFRDRGAVLQLFLLPFVFIFVFSGLGSFGEEEEAALPLPVVNQDDGATSGELIAAIDAAGGVKSELLDEATAESQLEEGEIDWVLMIPADFSADIAANKPTTLRMISHPDADATYKETARLVIEGAAQDLALQTQVTSSLMHMMEMQAAMPPDQQAFTPERVLSQADNQFQSAAARPLVTVEQLRPGQLGKEQANEPLSGTQVTVPGFTVLFVFLASGATALSIYSEKKIGSFRRLLAAPMSKAEVLLGKMLPAFLIALAQVIVIFGVGMFLMPLLGMDGLSLSDHPLAVVLIVIAMALCAAGLGVLIAAFARTENQIGGGSAVLLWLMGALGGAFFPTYLLTGFFGEVGKIVPHYWAGKAFYGVMVRGQDLSGVATEIAIVFGFALLFWIVGVWRFEYE